MMVYTAAFIDRQLVNLVVDPIKRTMWLTDTQMSLLQGMAFTIAYVVFSPILGRLADSTNRRNLLIVSLSVWSLSTAAAGFATGFWTFLLARAGVGAAEAAVAPAAWSMLSDYFSRERLPRALSLFLIGPYVGGGLALIFGGLLIGSAGNLATTWPMLTGFEPWQLVFIIVGLPGLLLAASLLLIREPPRATQSTALGPDAALPSMAAVARYFWSGRAFFGRFCGGMAGIIITLYALPAWMPAYLKRRFDMDARSVGLEYGASVLVVGTIGVLTGPVIGRWIDRRGHPASAMLVAALSACALVGVSLMLPFAPTYAAGLVVAGLGTFFFSLPRAMAATALQLATPPSMRGMAAALYVFLVATIGLGVAPTVVALLTDYVFGDPERVGWSLGIVCAVSSAAGAWLTLGAASRYRAAVPRVADA